MALPPTRTGYDSTSTRIQLGELEKELDSLCVLFRFAVRASYQVSGLKHGRRIYFSAEALEGCTDAEWGRFCLGVRQCVYFTFNGDTTRIRESTTRRAISFRTTVALPAFGQNNS